MLKDFISSDSQTKFIKQNLNELKINFHSRGIRSPYFKEGNAAPGAGQSQIA
jgi:hypothetical protein